MNSAKVWMAGLGLMVVVGLSGCESIQGHEGAATGAAIGTLGGAAIGAAIGGKDNRTGGVAIGAAVGGITGAVVGDQAYDKKQEQK